MWWYCKLFSSRCGLSLVCYLRVRYHVEAPSQCDVDGQSSIQGPSLETRCCYLALTLTSKLQTAIGIATMGYDGLWDMGKLDMGIGAHVHPRLGCVAVEACVS